MNSQQLWEHVQGVPKLKKDKKWAQITVPPLAEKLLVVDNFPEQGRLAFLKGVSPGSSTSYKWPYI